ncbi:hypothetical protein KSU1_C0358 [Candidatus Jettenia caeni]|uniref:Uncharacterized protein n=1 Tax=Candidatus Jettenia caeni TaxID=247490 RepID=I3IJQ9_9BACT|nr:hypothetical protein KSU1_C0358 [Candidatus Jettenia caeni]
MAIHHRNHLSFDASPYRTLGYVKFEAIGTFANLDLPQRIVETGTRDDSQFLFS